MEQDRVTRCCKPDTVTAHLGTLVCVGSLKKNKKGNIISAQVWHHKVEVHESGANGTYHVVQLRTAVAAAVATVTRRPVTSVTPPRLDQWDCEVWPQASVLLTSKNTFEKSGLVNITWHFSKGTCFDLSLTVS